MQKQESEYHMSDTSNCRPVALATVVSKLLETLHIIKHLSLPWNHRQSIWF